MFFHGLRSDEAVQEKNAEQHIRAEFELIDSYFSQLESARRWKRMAEICLPDEDDLEMMAYTAGLQKASHGKIWNFLYRSEPLKDYLDEMVEFIEDDLNAPIEDQVAMLFGSLNSARANINASNGLALLQEYYDSKAEYMKSQLSGGKLDFLESAFMPNFLNKKQGTHLYNLFQCVVALRCIHAGKLIECLDLDGAKLIVGSETYYITPDNIEVLGTIPVEGVDESSYCSLLGQKDSTNRVYGVLKELYQE